MTQRGGRIPLTAKKEVEPVALPRCPDGTIDNCALNFGEPESACQMCGGRCPDAVGEGEARRYVRPNPGGNPPSPQTQALDALAERDRGPRMSPAFERILTRTYAIDVDEIARSLEGQLAIPDADRVDYGFIAKRAGTASENARTAHLLYVNAVAAREEFEARAETTLADIRRRALMSLAEAEAAGKLGKKKTVTNDDVEAEMARIAPDEYERLRVRRKKIELMVEQLKREAELHKHFPHTIETLLTTSRSPS